jgi:hypothetical protein
MKSIWVRVIEAHSVPVDEAEVPSAQGGLRAGDSLRRVRGSRLRAGKDEGPYGPAYLEVYTTGMGFGHDPMHHPEPVCFIAQVVDLSDVDFLVLHHAYTWADKTTQGVTYLPWERISAIRIVSGDA